MYQFQYAHALLTYAKQKMHCFSILSTWSSQIRVYFVNSWECWGQSFKGQFEAKFRSAYCSTNEAKPFAETSPLLHKENSALHSL